MDAGFTLPPPLLEIEASFLQAMCRQTDHDRGSMLLTLRDSVDDSIFNTGFHRMLWKQLCAFVEGGGWDMLSFVQRVKDEFPNDDSTKLMDYALGMGLVTAWRQEMIPQWLRELKLCAHRRSIVMRGASIARKASDGEDPGILEAEIMSAARDDAMKYCVTGADHIATTEADFDDYCRTLASGSRFSFGLRQIDSHGFLLPGYGVIAGRSGHGKTCLAVTTTLNNAMMGKNVLFWSGEMRKERIYARMLAQVSGAFSREVLGFYTPNEFDREAIAVGRRELARLPIRIIAGRRGMASIRAEALRLSMEQQLDVVVLDQLSMLRVDDKRYRTKEQVLGEVSGAMVDLAAELKCTVILLVQLNIKRQDESDPAPHAWHVKDCGKIYEDADWFMIVDRPEADVQRAEAIRAKQKSQRMLGNEAVADAMEIDGRAILRLEKDREGMMGDMEEKLVFNKACGRFESERSSGLDVLVTRDPHTTEEERDERRF